MSLLKYFKDCFLRFRLDDPTSKIVFDHYFFDLKYYLHQNTSNEEFSNLLNISSENLDKISLEYYGSSFHTLLNECRYRHFMEEIESSINSNLSIASIIKLSGFENNEKFVDFLKMNEEAKVLDNQILERNYKTIPNHLK